MEINEYFARHPEMMLGRMGMESGQYGMAPALIGNLEPGSLERAVSLLPAAVYKARDSHSPTSRLRTEQVPAAGAVKEGGLAERDGQIVVRRGDVFEPLTIPASVRARIRGMLEVRDAVREVFRTQLSDAPDEAIVEARRHLNRTYDFFTSRFGPLNARENVKAFASDPDLPLLVSLEEFNPETKRATKTAIFERRTLERYRPVERVETASEALLVSLNETGQISWPRMESLTGRTATELQDELGSLAYQNPESGVWETADRYLSGNVRTKLAVAQASERIDPAYRRNVEALRDVQPKDLEPGEIEARLGSSWIPPSDVRDFVTELLDVPRAGVKIGYAETIATWTVELDYGAKYVVNNTTTHGTARFRRVRLDRAIAKWAHADSLRRARGWQPDRKSAGNDCCAREAAAVERSFSRLGLGRSRTRRAARARIQFPIQQYSAPGFRRFASDSARHGPHLPPRRRSRAASEERRLAHPPGR